MATKTTRYVDDQGRIVLPAHIRTALNLASGNVVEVALEDDGTIRIRPTYERCCICGEGVEGQHRAEITVGTGKKFICYNCSQAIIRHITKG